MLNMLSIDHYHTWLIILRICDIVAFVMALMKTGGGGPNPARSQC